MELVRGLNSFNGSVPCVLSLGNFDGCHLGHKAILNELVVKAIECQLPATVITFEPYPEEFFAKTPKIRLMPLTTKLPILEA